MTSAKRPFRLISLLGILATLLMLQIGTSRAEYIFAWSSGHPKWAQIPLDGEWTSVILWARARYQGEKRSFDIGRTWHMETRIDTPDPSDGVRMTLPRGHGAGGVLNAEANQLVECSRDQCGANIEIMNCDSTSNDRTVTGNALVHIASDSTTELQAGNLSTTVTCDSGGSVAWDPGDENAEPGPISPVILDLDGNGFHLSGHESPVRFDIDADGGLEALTWTRPGELDAFLVLDLNRNGFIDNGSEMFGNNTWLLGGRKAHHGYLGLAQYDARISGGNEDRVLDAEDFIFDRLRLWIDENHDGMSSAVELLTLEEAGITRLELEFREDSSRDPHGNEFRYSSRAWRTHGRTEVPVRTTDVFFVPLD